MDIITTGTTKTSPEKLKSICDFIITILNDYKDRILRIGMKYGNLYDFLSTKAKEGVIPNVAEFNEKEYREALSVLEDDNIIALNGHSSAPTIRFA
jgi:hypothetical protein